MENAVDVTDKWVCFFLTPSDSQSTVKQNIKYEINIDLIIMIADPAVESHCRESVNTQEGIRAFCTICYITKN